MNIDDIQGIKLDLLKFKSDLKLINWMLGLILAGIIAVVTKTFF